jgi:NodT family efflux transporter outer membrane factor (OMF) lipoprotein
MRTRFLIAATLLVAGCSVGPDYRRPVAETPPAYKELAGWKVAEPQAAANGAWWQVFASEELSGLERGVDAANQNVRAAEARYREARALVAAARSEFFPTVTIGVSTTRSRFSATTRSSSVGAGRTLTEYSLPVDATWELDVWGRVRRNFEASRASAEASADDLAATRLSLEAELATDYFQLRTLDAQQRLLDRTVADYEHALQLTRNRYTEGVASRADVVQAEAQLETTRAQAIDVGVGRAQMEHAIAVLIGTPPAGLSLEPAPLEATPPTVPVGLPSALLERRPDVAAAERRVAAANAQIGVAEAAWYPTLVLSASGGFQTTRAADWFTWPSRFWSVGPAVSETVFDGGLRSAQTTQARATYDETVANYRQSVLAGFQEVEDDLAALRFLEREAEAQDAAVRAARESVAVAQNQYKAGLIGYLDVVVLQTAALNDERTAVDLLGRRMSSTVGLVKALGGTWDGRTTCDATASPGTAPARPCS